MTFPASSSTDGSLLHKQGSLCTARAPTPVAAPAPAGPAIPCAAIAAAQAPQTPNAVTTK